MSSFFDMLKSDPHGTLNQYPVWEGLILQHPDNCPNAGIVRFSATEHHNGFLIAPTNNRNGAQAYWLPWESKQTAEMTLGNRADFFLTSQLGGCRIVIIPSPTLKTPKVLHIAGDGYDPTGINSASTRKNWRNDEMAPHVNQRHYRKFSETQDNSYRSYTYPGDGGNIIGVRGKNGRWDFWLQCNNINSGSVFRLQKLTWTPREDILFAAHEYRLSQNKYNSINQSTNFTNAVSALYRTNINVSTFYRRVQSSRYLRHALARLESTHLIPKFYVEAIIAAYEIGDFNVVDQKLERIVASPTLQRAIAGAGKYIEKFSGKFFTFHRSSGAAQTFIQRLLARNHQRDEILQETKNFIEGNAPYGGRASGRGKSSRRTIMSEYMDETYHKPKKRPNACIAQPPYDPHKGPKSPAAFLKNIDKYPPRAEEDNPSALIGNKPLPKGYSERKGVKKPNIHLTSEAHWPNIDGVIGNERRILDEKNIKDHRVIRVVDNVSQSENKEEEEEYKDGEIINEREETP
ncbi:MAG: hypothetical protein GY750_04400 [Lentisphaerae bacterium]|nr:hypothetical protein [Lentisphaerota bacterium]MCP4100652.1 hypothetical protein [Lentisphaerota bacterium]